MIPGRRILQFFFALPMLSISALCSAQDVPAIQPGVPMAQPAVPAAPVLQPAAPTPAAKPSIALLLPLNSPDFAPAAEAVQIGCLAALKFSNIAPPLQVLRTDAQPATILADYAEAVKRGALVVVGPMTRSGVGALAASNQVTVNTLALNSAEGNAPRLPQLYTFSLSVEEEARLVARTAFAERLREVAIVQTGSSLAKRAARAFSDEWLALGGAIRDEQEFRPQTDLTQLKQHVAVSLSLSDSSGFVFLAADTEQARRVRPFLSNQMPVFATSMLNDGRSDMLMNGDLNGVRFVDMPWLVERDHPAVMVYPRATSFPGDLQRFYALGIDACRVAVELFQGRANIRLDGVTGKLTMRADNILQREPVQSVFQNGSGTTAEE